MLLILFLLPLVFSAKVCRKKGKSSSKVPERWRASRLKFVEPCPFTVTLPELEDVNCLNKSPEKPIIKAMKEDTECHLTVAGCKKGFLISFVTKNEDGSVTTKSCHPTNEDPLWRQGHFVVNGTTIVHKINGCAA